LKHQSPLNYKISHSPVTIESPITSHQSPLNHHWIWKPLNYKIIKYHHVWWSFPHQSLLNSYVTNYQRVYPIKSLFWGIPRPQAADSSPPSHWSR
jgi:hypothetical protein